MSGDGRRPYHLWDRSALRLGLLIALAAAGTASAADLKVGYIDSSRIFLEFKDAKEAQERFDRQAQGWRDEATEKEKLVKQLRDEVRDMSPILSALKRQEKEEALQKAIAEHERFIQSIWGPQGRAAQENERATQDVVNQIRAVVEKIASEKGLDLVFDSAGGFLTYANKSLDLTAEVVRQLNERSTSGSGR
ncbi:MAG: OmpH family outer membrane protein [Candidatus Eiseniibacteriota bacterium]